MVKILKFGGSSVATAERIKQVANIVEGYAKKGQVIIVVSALRRTTDQLLECAHLAATGQIKYKKTYKSLAIHHRNLLKKLIKKNSHSQPVFSTIEKLLSDLYLLLNSIANLRADSLNLVDLVASFGEQLSATIIAAYMNSRFSACYVDARQFMLTNDNFTHAAVLYKESRLAIRKYFTQLFKQKGKSTVPVVTGFIGLSQNKQTTTLGRDGSNYTATILAAALDAKAVEIWSDVDGVYSADPNLISSSIVQPFLSYNEAKMLAYFEDKVLRSAVIPEVVKKNISVFVKNTMNPVAVGTEVSSRSNLPIVKNISIMHKLMLITLSPKEAKIPYLLDRLYRVLSWAGIDFRLITQATPVHDVSFSIHEKYYETTVKTIEAEFIYELNQNQLKIGIAKNQSVIAIIGDNIKRALSTIGRIFISLEKNNIKLNGIAHGTEECNMSFIVNSYQGRQALETIHHTVFRKTNELCLVVVGAGHVGSAFLDYLQINLEYLKKNNIQLRVLAIADRPNMLLDMNGIDLKTWRRSFSASSVKYDPDDLIKQIKRTVLGNLILVDCTASSEVVKQYPMYIRANMHVITPNKRANVLPFQEYIALMNEFKSNYCYFLCNTNICAGLPVIGTLNQLISERDSVYKIEGAFSGTLGFLFNLYDGNKPFSELVRNAYKATLTEPDPREDLAGRDVARKLLILARQLGWKINLRDIKVENLVPVELRNEPFSKAFFKQLSKLDEKMKNRLKTAREHQAILCYVGRIIPFKSISAKLEEVPIDSFLAQSQGNKNIIAFTTERFKSVPLIIQGPGAGAGLTAKGIFADLMMLVRLLNQE